MFEGIRLVFTGYEVANIALPPGISTGGEYAGITTDIWATAGAYTPTLVEVAVTLGIVAFGALIVTLGLKYVPIQRVERPESYATDGGRQERQ